MKNKNILVPKLRFPQFSKMDGWEKTTLGKITKNISKKNKDRIEYPIYSINNRIGFIPQTEQFEGVDSNARGYDISLYKIIEENTFAYNPARINIGSIGYSGNLQNIIISSLYVCFKTKESINDDFLFYFFKSNIFLNSVNNNVEGGIRSYLFYENFARITFYLPKPSEQQKIADLLTSIDELIAEQNRKIDTLEKHKTGLIQQLFPTEGETVPKLRFPEFKNIGKWEEKLLGDVALFLKGKGLSKSDVVENGNLPCIRYGELYTFYNETINQVKSHTNISEEKLMLSIANDVIIPASGETKEDIATASCVLKSGIALGGDLNIIRTKINGIFLSYYLNNAKKMKIAQLAQGIAVIHLYASQLKTLMINIPKPAEQQKIADCLSSLDILIEEQNNKLTALQQHKRGLMQQIFPNYE